MTDAWFPLILLAIFIILVLTGQPSAAIIVIGAGAGDWTGTCDGEPVAFVVAATLTDTTGILVLPYEGVVQVWRIEGEWVGEGGCSVDWREE